MKQVTLSFFDGGEEVSLNADQMIGLIVEVDATDIALNPVFAMDPTFEIVSIEGNVITGKHFQGETFDFYAEEIVRVIDLADLE